MPTARITRTTVVVNGILRATVARESPRLRRPGRPSVDRAWAVTFFVLIAVGLPSGGGRPRGRERIGRSGPRPVAIAGHRGRVTPAPVNRRRGRGKNHGDVRVGVHTAARWCARNPQGSH